jgi:hypothetical protein
VKLSRSLCRPGWDISNVANVARPQVQPDVVVAAFQRGPAVGAYREGAVGTLRRISCACSASFASVRVLDAMLVEDLEDRGVAEPEEV